MLAGETLPDIGAYRLGLNRIAESRNPETLDQTGGRRAVVSSTQARPLRDGACIVWTREAGRSYLLGHLAAKGVGIVVDDGSEF